VKSLTGQHGELLVPNTFATGHWNYRVPEIGSLPDGVLCLVEEMTDPAGPQGAIAYSYSVSIWPGIHWSRIGRRIVRWAVINTSRD